MVNTDTGDTFTFDEHAEDLLAAGFQNPRLQVKHESMNSVYGNSVNAVKTQVWIAVSVYVLVAILRKELKLDRSLSEILQILSVTPFEKTPIFGLPGRICGGKRINMRGFLVVLGLDFLRDNRASIWCRRRTAPAAQAAGAIGGHTPALAWLFLVRLRPRRAGLRFARRERL